MTLKIINTMKKLKNLFDSLKAIEHPKVKALCKLLTDKEEIPTGETGLSYHQITQLSRLGVIKTKRTGIFKLVSLNKEKYLNLLRTQRDYPDILQCIHALKSGQTKPIFKKEGWFRVEYTPNLSNALQQLRKTGLLEKRKEGREVFWQKTEKYEAITNLA